ncbi:MAG: hypothetical protein PHP28_08630 [Actinomycetota bacterium]|nr:hypothetical protein [Actinomycetota bacterium]
MAEKLGLVREAEIKSEQAIDYYRKMAEESIAAAQAEVDKLKREEEEKAREEGEIEMREIVENGAREAEELRVEYMYDRMRLLAVVVERRKDAVSFLVERLEEGD